MDIYFQQQKKDSPIRSDSLWISIDWFMEQLPDKELQRTCPPGLFLSQDRIVTDNTGVHGVGFRAPAIAHFAYLEMQKRSQI